MNNQPTLPMNLHLQQAPLTALQEAIDEAVRNYCERNPYVVYGDYRDELSDNQVEALLEGNLEKFDELWWEVELSASDYADSEGYKLEMLKEIKSDLDLTDEQLDDNEDLISQALSESFQVDCSDLLQSCLRNTRGVHITAMLLDGPDGEPYGFPQWECGDEENAERKARLQPFIEDPMEAECMYSNEVLKICGTIELEDLYDRLRDFNRTSPGTDTFKMPTKIRVGPRDNDNALLHSGWQGSGNMGSIKFKEERVFDCVLEHDNPKKYGVDAVYGFTGHFWRHELDLVWEDDNG